MKKVALYSKSSHVHAPVPPAPEQAQPHPPEPSAQSAAPAAPAAGKKSFLQRHERSVLVLVSVLLSSLLFAGYTLWQAPPQRLTQKDIDAAVLHTVEKNVLPSQEARAFVAIRPSVVRVRQLGKLPQKDADVVRGIGSGVVIVDKGVILTNLHVVSGAERVQVVFANGEESEAKVINVQPENDLAVLQAKTVPDDLVPATLKSTQDLSVGDHVIAVGFPFGIGPSVSGGIVSGLRREYASPDGKHLSNLIQFDAAANPGNSGGPLVTMDGAVVGIVTAILNPTPEDVFIGIGFAIPIENAASAVGTSPF